MAMLVYIKRLRSISAIMLFSVVLLLAGSCKKNDLRALYDDAGNHNVYKISADVFPLQETIGSGDTVWIEISIDELELEDEISGRTISMDNAQFLTQFELFDMIDNDKVVNVQYLLTKGAAYDDQHDFTQSSKNSYGFKFGYPDANILKLGVILSEPGYYAIWFNNLPNPYFSCKGNNCDVGKGFWYDIAYDWNSETSSFKNEDFVEYYFNLEGGAYDKSKFDAGPFLEYCVYNNSVIFLKVR